MSKEYNQIYENFIRAAFEKAYDEPIERFGDPAILADADVFDLEGISKVKAAVSYSIAIFNSQLSGQYLSQLSNSDYDDLDLMMNKVINASNKEEIYNLISEYKNKYFHMLF